MTNLLFPLALALMGFATWGFFKNHTALTNVVVFALGVVVAGTWLAERVGAGWFITVVAALIALAMLAGLPVLVIALLANGVVMFRRESRKLGNLLSFVAGVLIIAMYYSMVQIFGPWDINTYLAWAWFSAAMVLGYFAAAFLVYLVASWLYSAVPTTIKPDYGIVLGARLIDGQVPPLLQSRLDRAIVLYREFEAQGHVMKLIPTGGQGHDETKPEGVGMAEYLVAQGIPEEHVVIEDKAVNTRENLVLSRALMDSPDAPNAVITNNFHVFRAALLARKLGLKSHVFGSPTKFYYLPSAVIREFLAIMVQYKWLNLLVVLVLLAIGVAGLVEALRPVYVDAVG